MKNKIIIYTTLLLCIVCVLSVNTECWASSTNNMNSEKKVIETYDKDVQVFSYTVEGNDEKILTIENNTKTFDALFGPHGAEYLDSEDIQKLRDKLHSYCPVTKENGNSDKLRISAMIVVQSDGSIICQRILSKKSLTEIMTQEQIKGIFNIIESYNISSIPQASEKYYYHYTFWIRRY